MTVTATITGDCKYLNLILEGNPGNVDVTISNAPHTYPVSANIPQSGTTNILLYLPSTVGTTYGIFRVEATDSQAEVGYAGAFGSCSLDCCMAKKVDALLGCGCGCTKCNDNLTQAERVHLLIAGINADMSQIKNDASVNLGIYTNASKKYESALKLCADDCGCGC